MSNKTPSIVNIKKLQNALSDWPSEEQKTFTYEEVLYWIEVALEDGIDQGYDTGSSSGYEEGYDAGYEDGYSEATENARVSSKNKS